MEVVSEGYAARNRLSLDNSSRKVCIRVIALQQRQTRQGGGKPPRYFLEILNVPMPLRSLGIRGMAGSRVVSLARLVVA